MALLVEGVSEKKFRIWDFPEMPCFLLKLLLPLSTKRAISPIFFEQIELFQCLKASTAQGPSPQNLRIHVVGIRCPQMHLKVSGLLNPLQIHLDVFCNSSYSQFSLHISGNLGPNLTSRDSIVI